MGARQLEWRVWNSSGLGLLAVMLCVAGCGRLGFKLSAHGNGADGSFSDAALSADSSPLDLDAGASPDAAGLRDAGTDAASDSRVPLGGDAGADSATDVGVDTGTDAGFPPCVSGQVLAPVGATDVSPWASGVCSPDNVLVEDDLVAGLDLFGGTAAGCDSATWPGTEPCSCVAVDFGQVFPVDYLTVRAGASSNACGQPCGVGQCDTGRTGGVGYGLDETSVFDNPTSLVLNGPALQSYRIAVGDGLRWAVVCRVAFSEDRDDLVVDSITATCL